MTKICVNYFKSYIRILHIYTLFKIDFHREPVKDVILT